MLVLYSAYDRNFNARGILAVDAKDVGAHFGVGASVGNKALGDV